MPFLATMAALARLPVVRRFGQGGCYPVEVAAEQLADEAAKRASGQRTPRPRLVAAMAGWDRPPDGLVFPGYAVSEMLALCRSWQRPPPPAG
jgi:hypothetical protein